MSECSKNATIPPEVGEFLASCTNLPSLPSVVLKIIEASKDPDIGLADVAQIIQVDPALSAKLLKVANSSMYARRREITNLRDALALLGLNASLIIALSFSLVKSLSSSADNSMNYEEFWKRSILSATIARQIGFKLKLPNLEDFFLASLLQDIGILAIDCTNPEGLPTEFNASHLSRVNSEQDKLGLDHSDIGAWLLKSWNLPEKLYKAVLCSHTDYTQPVETHEEEIFYQCVSMSGNLSDVWFEEDREAALQRNLRSIESLLGFDKKEFNAFINEISNVLPEISSMFDIKIVDDKKREQVINEARDILMVRNISLIKQFEDHRDQIKSLTAKSRDIEEEAKRDHLTHAYNRKYIDQLLLEEFEKSKKDHTPLSVAFIDIDDFKPINDSHGHLAGDKVLIETADFFTRKIRKTDTLARYGGDEFLLMLPNTDTKTAMDLLRRLVIDLKAAPGTEFKGQSIKVSTSIGVATLTGKSNFEELSDLIHAADKALYNAKKAGKDSLMDYF